MEALILIEGIVILLLVILVAGLLRSHAEILRQLDALGAGEHHEQSRLAPPRRRNGGRQAPLGRIEGESPTGGVATLSLSESKGHTLLAFLSTTCTACGVFWDQIPEERNGVRPVVVTKGAEAESPSQVARLANPAMTTLMSTRAWEDFAVPATPYFALVDNRDGRVVGEGSAPTWSQVEDMVSRALADDRHALGRSTSQRKADTDAELADAGIEPGDARLFQPPVDHP